MLRNVAPKHDLLKIDTQWIAILKSADGDSYMSAQQMYCGEHWSIVRDLPALASKFCKARIWICSAGYGLITPETDIHSYSATFATAEADCVTSGVSTGDRR